jgi:hypothetical protein
LAAVTLALVVAISIAAGATAATATSTGSSMHGGHVRQRVACVMGYHGHGQRHAKRRHYIARRQGIWQTDDAGRWRMRWHATAISPSATRRRRGGRTTAAHGES